MSGQIGADLLVSVVMPAFNASNTISDSIKSVLEQTYPTWELLIVDDGSEDDTQAVVRSFLSDSRIRLLTGAGRGGPAKARNVGLDAATGDMVAFLDSDDRWLPQKMEKQLAFMVLKGARVSYTSYWCVEADGHNRRSLVEASSSVTYESMLGTNGIGCLTAMYDRRAFPDARMPDVGRFAEGTWMYRWLNGRVGHEDYAFWLALMRSPQARLAGFALGIDEPLALYRLSANSLSGNKLRAAAFQWLVYRSVERLPLSRATASFVRYAIRGLRKHNLKIWTADSRGR
jgi:teichuronic acid biosynthesis glycosyltransferase TuaG